MKQIAFDVLMELSAIIALFLGGSVYVLRVVKFQYGIDYTVYTAWALTVIDIVTLVIICMNWGHFKTGLQEFPGKFFLRGSLTVASIYGLLVLLPLLYGLYIHTPDGHGFDFYLKFTTSGLSYTFEYFVLFFLGMHVKFKYFHKDAGKVVNVGG